METTAVINEKKRLRTGWGQGVVLTLTLALVAQKLVSLPGFSIMGQLVIAILLGILWRAVMGVPESAVTGIQFSSKKLLRYGIILLGMRLNLGDILHAGPKVLAIAIINIVFTIFVVYWISKMFSVEKKLGILTACGTAICGAAAVIAISPQLKANDDETAVGAATVAILGTIFTVVYTLLYPFLGLTQAGYGVFAGGTLHEVAHVIAAAAPGGNTAVDMAVIVKLTRVALLVPIAVIIGFLASVTASVPNGRKLSFRNLPIPWFIFGFLAMSAVNTIGIFTHEFASAVVSIAYFLMAMAMAGLGLNVDIITFRRMGLKAAASGFIGSVLLSVLGFALLKVFNIQ